MYSQKRATARNYLNTECLSQDPQLYLRLMQALVSSDIILIRRFYIILFSECIS